ncbi:prepilin peptidase [Phenylobacterium sp.]|uniref:prepilin peptidase n=1 Tax=Phenylobacterium sp. TaxID=1871053 RepID=UPI002FC58D9D
MIDASPILLVGSALVGAVTGSFAVTAAMRSAGGHDAVGGRSRCDQCGVALAFARTIPLLSFALHGGRCHACQGEIARDHLAGEGSGLALGFAAGLTLPLPLAATAIAMGSLLIFVAAYDIRTLRIPDWASAGTAGLGALAAFQHQELLASLAVALGMGVMLFLGAAGFQRVRGRPGLGGGDIKLAVGLSLWTGPMLAGVGLLAACAAALVWVACLRPAGRLAFGPFLALGFWTVGLAGAIA